MGGSVHLLPAELFPQRLPCGVCARTHDTAPRYLKYHNSMRVPSQVILPLYTNNSCLTRAIIIRCEWVRNQELKWVDSF